MKYIETERLILRDWKDEDIKLFASMNADPIVMQYYPRKLGEKETKKLVGHFRDHFKKHGYGLYAVELKSTGGFIGFVGLDKVTFDAPFTPATEIAWRLDYEYWGKGYATEAAKAVLDYAFDKLKLKEVVAFAVNDNDAAIKIMDKLGMTHDAKDDFDWPGLRKDHPLGRFVLYRIKNPANKAKKKK